MAQLMHSFRGTHVPEDVLAMVRRGDVVSFCIFAMNVESPAHLRQMTDSIRAAAQAGGQLTPIIGIDQEGGQLIAVRGGTTELPGNMALGATRSPELAEQAGRVLGRELLAMGINMNFAPTLDVNINPENPVIGVRSFGDHPALVAELGAAMIRGMQAEGIIATAKHFPGHGDTADDSHHAVPVVAHDLKRLEEVELMPFRAALHSRAIMSSHIIYPALDAEYPATISRKILHDLLRDSWGYNGLIVTDAMDMHAVARLGARPSVEAALRAGADIVMLGHLADQPALTATVRSLFNAESVMRIQQAQQQLPVELPDLSVIGSHQAIAQAIADRSITVVRDTAGRLPIGDGTLAVVTVKPVNLTPADTSADVEIKLAAAIHQRRADAFSYDLPYQATDAQLRDALAAVADYETVVVGTINADESQAAFVNALIQRGQMPIVVALRTPYDITAFPQIDTYLCAYGIRDVTTEAVARVLFGEIQAAGVLPCAIPGIMTAV